MTHATIDEAEEIDSKIVDVRHKGFICISYQLLSSAQRMAATCSNDVFNSKARFKILFNANLKNKAHYQRVSYVFSNLLKERMVNGMKLFLAVEPGLGQNKGYTHVAINPKTRNKSRKQLVEEHATVVINYDNENTISVDVQKYNTKKKYSDGLKEFLTPTLTTKQ